LAIDGKMDTYWASTIGYPILVFWIGCGGGTVKEIEINWKYQAEDFDLYLWRDGVYLNYAHV
jgi:hypothetical protein